jgi:RNA polymerase sigma-70 factor (ECF subfamily)
MSGHSEALEEAIRRACRSEQLDDALTAALEGYGPEVLGFLVATLRREEDASEVFSMLAEDLWRGLPRFRWDCSFRTWLYCLARHASSRHRRSSRARERRFVPLSAISDVADRVRSHTLPYLRTEMKSGIARLRESLEPEDQALLILRVDRKLSWEEVARVLASEEDAELDEAALRRASARLRKRMQQLKRSLRERAAREGLLGDDE